MCELKGLIPLKNKILKHLSSDTKIFFNSGDVVSTKISFSLIWKLIYMVENLISPRYILYFSSYLGLDIAIEKVLSKLHQFFFSNKFIILDNCL